MQIIPVIDLRSGRCSRAADDSNPLLPKLFSQDPLEQAIIFQNLGVRTIHIVDLDGVFCGSPRALDTVQKIVSATDLIVQISGGYQSMDAVFLAAKAGAHRIVLTTAAVRTPQLVKNAAELFVDKIAVGIDAKDGIAAIEGWEYTVDKNVFTLAAEIKELGVKSIIYNDINRIGRLCEPDYATIARLCHDYDISVTVCGGIGSFTSIQKLRDLGVEGVLVGKAIYSGALDLQLSLNILA